MNKEVTRVRVGVHEMVNEDLFQVRVVQLARQFRPA